MYTCESERGGKKESIERVEEVTKKETKGKATRGERRVEKSKQEEGRK